MMQTYTHKEIVFETIRHNKPTCIKGIPVELDEPSFIKGIPLFAYKDGIDWHIIEAASGLAISSSSFTLAIAKAQAVITLFEVGEKLFKDARMRAIWKYGGLNLEFTGLAKGWVNQ